MKLIFASLISVFALAGFALAADEEVTVSGKLLCAHCDLSIGDSCNEAVKQNEVVYLLTGEVAKKFFADQTPKAVTATGKVTDKTEYKELVVTKIAVAETK